MIFDPCFFTSLLQVMSSLSLSTICCDTRKNRKKNLCLFGNFFLSPWNKIENPTTTRRPLVVVPLNYISSWWKQRRKGGTKDFQEAAFETFSFFDKKDDLLPEILKKWPTNKKANSFCLKRDFDTEGANDIRKTLK